MCGNRNPKFALPLWEGVGGGVRPGANADHAPNPLPPTLGPLRGPSPLGKGEHRN
jgi:hypothetical protein